jgi:hypothetical protein
MATVAVEKETKKRERGKGDKKMGKENMEHETGFKLSGLPAHVESGPQELYRNSQHHRAAICRVGENKS